MRRILVVDDESNMRFLIRMILEPEGYQVIEAKHGAEALELVKETKPDVVVTDLMMPVMDGLELIKHLRSDSETAGLPIVVITLNAERPIHADVVLGKPFDPDALLDSVAVAGRGEATL